MTIEEQALLCGERFARYKERIEQLEDDSKTTAQILQEASAGLQTATKQLQAITEQVKDHETRLRDAEKKPSMLWDKVISGIISAIVAAAMAYLIMGA